MADHCFGVFSGYSIQPYIPFVSEYVGVGSLLIACIYIVVSGLTIYWIRLQRYYAQTGIEGSVKFVIFDVYEPFLWSSALSDCFLGMTVLFFDAEIGSRNSLSASIAYGLCYGLQHFVLEGIHLCTCFACQKLYNMMLLSTIMLDTRLYES